MEVWFGSDFHFDHENIVKGVSKWEDTRACRPFDTLEEHNETLIQNINNCVKKDDILFFDGDWAFNGRTSIYDFRKRLNCKTIHFILGNHDHHIRKNAVVNDELNIKAHSLFTSVNDILYKKINGQKFVLCHYSMRTWDNAHHGAIMLYGHSHGSLPDYTINLDVDIKEPNGTFIKTIEQTIKFKTMDIGIDTHPEFRPYHYDEIVARMSESIPLRVDHHVE